MYIWWFKGAWLILQQSEREHFLWQYPEGYLEAQKEKEEAAAKEEEANQKVSPKTPKDKTNKRKRSLDTEAEVRRGNLSIILNFFFTSTSCINDIDLEKSKYQLTAYKKKNFDKYITSLTQIIAFNAKVNRRAVLNFL